MNKILLNAGPNYTVKYVNWCYQCHCKFDEGVSHTHLLTRVAAIAYKK